MIWDLIWATTLEVLPWFGVYYAIMLAPMVFVFKKMHDEGSTFWIAFGFAMCVPSLPFMLAWDAIMKPFKKRKWGSNPH